MNFLPLKHYYRSLAVALIVPLLVAFLLCLHLYNIKLDRAVAKREADFANIAAQVEHAMNGADGLINTLFSLYEQPLSYQFEPQWLEDINQQENYYYRKIPDGGGEIVGQGKFSTTPNAIAQWQQVIALGPAFNTALSLIQSLSAVAYVNEQGFVYIKRRRDEDSLMLTQVLDGQLRPALADNSLTSSAIVEVAGKNYLSIGRAREQGSEDYIILIYDLSAVSQWLKKISPRSGEYIFLNSAQHVIISSLYDIEEDTPLAEYWPSAKASLAELDNQGNLTLLQAQKQLPIYAGYFASHDELASPIVTDVLIELTFLSMFLVMMFSTLLWLSQRIFVKPMTYLMAYLEQNEEHYKDYSNYHIPANWQPWFSRIKWVLNKNQQLVNSLQQANSELDDQVKIKTRELARSYEAKERHLALLNTMLNSVPDLIYFKNIDGSFLGCNRAYEQYIGIEQGQLVGQQLCDISDDNGQISELEQQVLTTKMKAEQRLETQLQTFQLTIAPFYNDQNQLLGSMGIGRDITAQQQALLALKASESKFRSAIEYAANGVILLSLEQTVLQLNRTARKIFKIDKTEQDLLLVDLFPRQQWQEIATLLALLLSEKKKVYHLTLGQEELNCWWQLSVSLVWDEQQAPYYYVIHIQDVSALTQAKQDAERATEAKSRFIANLSHEIRTPLHAVTGLIDMVTQQGLTAQQQQHAVQAKNAAQSLLTMLNRMLDFARIENNQVQLDLVDFAVVALVDSCESVLIGLCQQKYLAFNIDIDPLIAPQLVGDYIRLQQVLGNLLTNAVKFTEHGSITLKITAVELTPTKQTLCFKVIDTGIGIDKADQSRLFDAFTQGDESLTRTHQGVGLGLAIVKHELALMGAEIKVVSNKGQGSEFFFTITFNVAAQIDPIAWHNTLVIHSERGINLPAALAPLKPLEFSELAELTDHAVLADYQRIIINDVDLPRVITRDNIKTALMSNNTQLYVVKNAPNTPLPTLKGMQMCSVKSSALVQRIQQVEPVSKRPDVNLTTAESKLNVAGLLVLVIDDNQLNLDIISNILSQAHINVMTANSAMAGIDLVAQVMPDLILMDIQMPEVDGLQATALLRQRYDQQQLPIFALTAHCEAADEQRSLAVGMNKHLTKPVVAATLLAAINELKITGAVFYNHSFALEQFSGHNDLLQVMLGKLAKLCVSHLQQLKVPMQTKALERLVHSIKGVSGNLGFNRLSATAQQLESRLRKTPDVGQISLSQLEFELVQVNRYIQIQGSVNVEESQNTDR
ncbi:response regulator [Pseudoalteromonas sp. SG41-1]|uniref:PAS domain-containing hybrid sensor histidine kinase/response regulator n=1 Tax=Pseudoalteromonas sp. SG41-1 TaxID=2760979 RepID=UPI001603B816|nr:PAS domain-containing hybrid sensor histidine kinase/response regulator [Pseudoalteromonas sp. SG41-1]MBB1505328.1 response regulator [Pseudoalteromonas sp. SG41-1]